MYHHHKTCCKIHLKKFNLHILALPNIWDHGKKAWCTKWIQNKFKIYYWYSCLHVLLVITVALNMDTGKKIWQCWSQACYPRHIASLIARFTGPTWGPSGADRTEVGSMLAPWTLLSEIMHNRAVLMSWTEFQSTRLYHYECWHVNIHIDATDILVYCLWMLVN